ncbi:hypothetical protein B5M09_002966 [Aphanomyces astaci]|uniref:C2H2-type domain-containing protein n=1 Tax=Aphanomyces astaci TaxID=112090 RepID=A0A425C3D0_APHAT|nr:hypothetical protein B5M09_002966 [Aphanomyces astaci]
MDLTHLTHSLGLRFRARTVSTADTHTHTSAGTSLAYMTDSKLKGTGGGSGSHMRRQIPDWERKFQCPHPHCGKRFTRKFSMTEHIKTHTGDKPHECTVPGCGKKFTTAGNLARHRKIHDGVFHDKIDASSPSSSTSSTSNRLMSRRSSESFPQLQARTPPGLNHSVSSTIDFHDSSLQSHIDAHHPTDPHSSMSFPAHLQKRRASLPASLLGAHVRYRPPHHQSILGNNNDSDLLFDDTTIQRAKMDAIRDFETGLDNNNPMDKYAPSPHNQASYGQSQWSMHQQHHQPLQAYASNASSNYMKPTRSQSLTHQQLHSQLHAMQQLPQQPYSFKFMGHGSPQPTDVDLLLQEEEEDNQMKTSPVEVKGQPRQASPWPSNYNMPQRGTFPPEMNIPPPPLDFDTTFNDPFFDENAIIDMLFGGDGPQQQVEPTTTLFHQEQSTYGGRV